MMMECVFRTYPLSLLSGDNTIALTIQLVPNQEQLSLFWCILTQTEEEPGRQWPIFTYAEQHYWNEYSNYDERLSNKP